MRGYTQQEVGRPHAPAPNRFARGNGCNPHIAFKLGRVTREGVTRINPFTPGTPRPYQALVSSIKPWTLGRIEKGE